MTLILIVTDWFAIGFLFFLLIVLLLLVGVLSPGLRRSNPKRIRQRSWHDNEPTQPLIGIGLFTQPHETTNHDDLAIFKSPDNTGNATHIDNSGSVLGLNDGTETRSVDNSGGYDSGLGGGLGAAAADHLNSDNSGSEHTNFTDSHSESSDWSSGGSFGDSGGYSSVSGSSFSDSSSDGSFSSE